MKIHESPFNREPKMLRSMKLTRANISYLKRMKCQIVITFIINHHISVHQEQLQHSNGEKLPRVAKKSRTRLQKIDRKLFTFRKINFTILIPRYNNNNNNNVTNSSITNINATSMCGEEQCNSYGSFY